MNTNLRRTCANLQPGFCLGLIALASLSLACVPASPETLAAANDEAEDAPHGPEPVTVTHFSEELCLFLEYPRLYPGVEARFLAHFTVLENGSALEAGSVSLELSVGGVTHQVLSAGAPTRPGLFVPEWTATEPGTFEAKLVIDSPEVKETIALPNVIVHADLTAADAAAHEEAHAGPGTPVGAVQFLMEQQWSVGLLTEPIERRVLKEELRVNGEVAMPSSMTAHVNAPLAGTLLGPIEGKLPQLGDRVTAGQVLGRIQPPLSFGDQAQTLGNRVSQESMAMEIALRKSDVRASQSQARAAVKKGETSLLFAEKALARIAELRTKDLGTIEQLESAERDREIAVRELSGIHGQLDAYSKAEADLEALSADLEALDVGGSAGAAPTLPLRAPIDGVVQSIHHVYGEALGESSTVWEIVNHDRVWVLAHVSQFDLTRMPASPRARVQFGNDARSSNDLGQPLPRQLSNFNRDARTMTLTYTLESPDATIVNGMGADVFVELGSALNAASIPVEAIVKENGRPIAFVLVNGEMFQRRELKLGLHSGPYVQILEGLRSGERVVTNAAYLLKLASAAPAEFGHGHAH
jgi:membrane fusion protein, heavy metal efflux system